MVLYARSAEYILYALRRFLPDAIPAGSKSPMLTPISRSRSLTQDAYGQIKSAIIANELKPGQQLKEEELASQLGISSTPLREALAKLEQEWLIETIPHRGKFVAEITPDNVKELFEVRCELEGLAVELAMPSLVLNDLEDLGAYLETVKEQYQQADDFDQSLWFESETRLHELIIQNCGNQWLIRLLTTLNDHIWRIRGFRVTTPGTDTRQSFLEHLAIWEAIQAKDVAKTKELMEEHLRNAGERLTRFLAEKVEDASQQHEGDGYA
jgi:DNA-binding GntR family transcriptional regulator